MDFGATAITQQQAKDELYGVINATFAVVIGALTPVPEFTPKIIWEGREVPSPEAPFIYATPYFECLSNQQRTLRNVNGKRFFERIGLLSVQIYAPKSDAVALQTAQTIGAALEIALSKASPSGDIWFRDAHASVAKGTATQNQVNVITSCTFNQEQ